MSENSAQDKSEQATPQKLKKAKEEGQVPRSKDLASSALIMVGAGLLMSYQTEIASQIVELTQFNMMIDKNALREADILQLHLASSLMSVVTILAPILLILMLTTIVTGSLPGGVVLSGKNLGFKYNRIDPIKGIGRIFSTRSLVELLKSVLKIILLAGIMINLLSNELPSLLGYSQLAVDEAITQGIHMLAMGMLYLSLGLLIITFIDVPYQFWQHGKELRMSKQEIKEEQKQQEGSPEVKGRIRQLQQKISRSRADVSIPQADVLLVNPTHYSVALKYDEQKSDAPYVLTKGTDELALYMKQIAKKHDVEIVEIPALTRAVYYSTQVEQQIPAALFVAIAHILNYVMQLRAARQGKQKAPAPLPNFFIPPHLRHD
ncbi:flagellar biosynthesis protein FlhB [Shewanella sp. 202IG2-18]|uniref:flagellar biosynthesis protein FlhB n=1 Tax=Parashewanella hymeniacidonis TaxID=2807618 RepID=UPI00195F4C59|nr:flagellar biosynthesis protein FlhB [Parashewanella hymeniacidonis]MBM7071614.1 flagellar biosynthesis protein FlhB [Parashewanella hymeniacidonis]